MTVTGLNNTTYKLNPIPIGSGGEGDIYDIYGSDRVAKIYKPGTMSKDLEEKLKLMVSKPPDASVLSQVAWPLDIVYNASGRNIHCNGDCQRNQYFCQSYDNI